jgi:hypothetical protein
VFVEEGIENLFEAFFVEGGRVRSLWEPVAQFQVVWAPFPCAFEYALDEGYEVAVVKGLACVVATERVGGDQVVHDPGEALSLAVEHRDQLLAGLVGESGVVARERCDGAVDRADWCP